MNRRCLVIEWDPAKGTVAWRGQVVAADGALRGVRGPSRYQVQPAAGGRPRWVAAGAVEFDPRQPSNRPATGSSRSRS